MASNKIELLYMTFARLADENSTKDDQDYLIILDAVRGSTQEKKLACQFISRFFEDFPHLSERALEAHLDLCEDEDIVIRKLAIRELAAFCRHCPTYTYKIADILSQLIVVKDLSENIVVSETLQSLVKLDILDTMKGIFNQVKNGDDEVRDRCLKFFGVKVLGAHGDMITPSIMKDMISEIKPIFEDASNDEITLLMSYLWRIGLGKSPEGRSEFISIITEILRNLYKGEFSDDEAIEYYFVILRQTMSLLKVADATPFLKAFIEVVLPNIKKMPGYKDGSSVVLEMFKSITELVNGASEISHRDFFLEQFHTTLLDFLPELKVDTASSDTSSEEEPKLLFSYVECLLFIVHRLASGYPQFFTEYPERLHSLKNRLHGFARALQGYIKSLETVVEKDSKDKIKIVALKTTTNINQLTKDFFFSTPEFKTTVTLSWDPLKGNTKRQQSNIKQVLQPTKRSKTSHPLQIYQPPGGKYSSTIKQFPSKTGTRKTPTSHSLQSVAMSRRPLDRSGRWNNGNFKKGTFQRWVQ